MEIKPIETIYDGYKFRSRLEARWAVFFDALGVPYEYEPEGFVLPSGRQYLPDFKVKCYGTRGHIGDNPWDLWIEVKGNMSKEDASKIKEFSGINDSINNWLTDQAEEDYRPVLVVGNIPAPENAWDPTCEWREHYKSWEVSPFNYELIDGDWFGAFPAALDGKFYLWGDEGSYIHDVEPVQMAYAIARQARFEHGATPILNN